MKNKNKGKSPPKSFNVTFPSRTVSSIIGLESDSDGTLIRARAHPDILRVRHAIAVWPLCSNSSGPPTDQQDRSSHAAASARGPARNQVRSRPEELAQKRSLDNQENCEGATRDLSLRQRWLGTAIWRFTCRRICQCRPSARCRPAFTVSDVGHQRARHSDAARKCTRIDSSAFSVTDFS